MLECPGCKLPLANDAICCNSCGWVKTATGKVHDPDHWRCVHIDRGQRCANAGVVSPAVHGGAFYCWQHVPAMQQFKDGVRTPPPEGFFAGWRKKLGPRPIDFEAEAERKALQAPDEP